MPHFLSNLEKDFYWQLFVKSWVEEKTSHGISFFLPEELLGDFVPTLQDFFLHNQLQEKTASASTDIHVIGDMESPPSIDECRSLALELSLFPNVLTYKIGMIYHGDRLSSPGANSLLKLVEEPPKHCFLVFLHSHGPLIPTLASRVWEIPLLGNTSVTRKFFSLGKGEGRAFSPLVWEKEFLRELEEKKLLTTAMYEDMLCLITKEDYSIGNIFSHIW